MSTNHIDHITITAPSLSVGAEFVRQALGIEPQIGGEHPRMGTHNLLLRLGESTFLEVISPNPAATPPMRARWFGLDGLRDSLPRLSAWVVRTANIHATAAVCSEPLGAIEPMSRGALDWLITIPADGSVPVDGVGPALIEWHADDHPAARLADHRLSLVRLELFHPEPDRVSRLLDSLEIDGPLSVGEAAHGTTPHLVAHIETPDGFRQLSGL